VIRRLARHVLHMRFWAIYQEACLIKMDCTGIWSVKRFLCGGVRANWSEFLFCLRTRHPFCQPTYFSFLGLFNIQRYGQVCNLHWRTVAVQIEELTDGSSRDDGHHFDCPENFCFDGSKLRILDYGSKRTQRVITAFGVKILASFDPDWVERGNE